MSHKNYLLIILGTSLMAWGGFVTVILKFDPFRNTSVALAFFYLSLFIALSGTFTLIGYFFRIWLYRNEIFYIHLNMSLRQGVLLALIAISCFILLMLKVLTWWSGGLLIAAALLIELYFASKEDI